MTRPPASYMKQLYFDTVCYHPPAVQCAIDTIGIDQVVFGSDSPPVPIPLVESRGHGQAIENFRLKTNRRFSAAMRRSCWDWPVRLPSPLEAVQPTASARSNILERKVFNGKTIRAPAINFQITLSRTSIGTTLNIPADLDRRICRHPLLPRHLVTLLRSAGGRLPSAHRRIQTREHRHHCPFRRSVRKSARDGSSAPARRFPSAMD